MCIRDSSADGHYALRGVASDLLRFLSRSRIAASLLPDLARVALDADAPNSVRGPAHGVSQSSNSVLMVAPTAFGFNEQTAADNHFMHTAARPGEGDGLTSAVLREFAALHHQLTEVHGARLAQPSPCPNARATPGYRHNPSL